MGTFKLAPSDPTDRYNYFVMVAILLGLLLLFIFVPSLIQSHAGEVAAAIGSVIGGIVGAGGAVGAVYFLINRQRLEERNNVSDAIRREIIEFNEMVLTALSICEHIKSRDASVMRKNAHTIMINLDPIIYRAVADRIGLLSHPQFVVKFYTRLVEIQQAIQTITVGNPGDAGALVPGDEAETLASSLIITCRLAQAIISQVADPSLDEQVPLIALAHIDTALESAKRAFPKLIR